MAKPPRIPKKARDELREHRERLSLALEASGVGIWRWEVESDRVTWGPNIYKLFGLERGAFAGTIGAVLNCVHPDDRERVGGEIRESVEGGAAYDTEYRVVRPGGDVIHVAARGNVYRDASGKAVQMTGAAWDVTARTQAEQALAASERRLSEILENVRLAVVFLDVRGQVTFCNDYLAGLIGWKREAIEGRNWFREFLPGEGRDRVHLTFVEAMETGRIPAHVANDIVTGSGARRTILWNNTVLTDPSGRIVGTASIGEDITERRQAEERLKLFRTIIEKSDEAVAVSDAAGRLLYVNPAHTRLFGRPLDEAQRMNYREFYPPESVDVLDREAGPALARGESWEGEVDVFDMGGRRFPLWERAGLVLDDHGKPLYRFGFMHDVSDKRRAEEQLLNIAKGVAGATGEMFFRSLVEHLAKALNLKYVFVGELIGADKGRIRTLAFYSDGRIADDFEYDLANTPCNEVVGKRFSAYPEGVTRQYPGDALLKAMEVEGYAGIPLFDSTGRSLGILAVFHDRPLKNLREIENLLRIFAVRAAAELERKRYEENLAEERHLFRAMIDTIPHDVFLKDKEGRFLIANRVLREHWAKDGFVEYEGRTDFDLMNSREAERHREQERWILETGKPLLDKEFFFFDDEERPHWRLSSKTAFRDAGGEIVGILGINRDITELKKVQEALGAAEIRSHELFVRMSSGVAVFEPVGDGADFVFKDINPAGERIYSRKKEDLLGRSVLEAFPGLQDLGLFEIFQNVLKSGEAQYHPASLYEDDALVLWVENRVYKLPSGEIVAVFDDVTEKKRAEEDLRRSRGKYQSIVDNLGIGIALISPDFRVLEWNRKMKEWFPGADAGAHPFCNQVLCHDDGGVPSHSCPTARTFQDGGIHEEEIHFERGGRKVTCRVVSSPIRDADGRITSAIEFIEDITERLQLEDQLRQSQKMEAVGQLAGGVAHDYNNMLQTILGSVDLAMAQARAGEDCRSELAEILAAGQRSAELTRQLLAFSRRQVLRVEFLDLNERIGGLLRMIRRVIPENIEVQFIPGHHVGLVRADPAQIDQILMNLCLNARDAMPEGGSVTIETENVLLDEAFCESRSWAKPGRYILTSVSDTGVGMAPEVRERVFEPFFTTKEPGEGTGLGLAMVYGIVSQHEGLIHVHSEVGKGTLFKTYLPVVEQKATDAETAPKGPTPTGKATILVAEDDASVRDVVCRILRTAGYEVLMAEDGEKAIEVLDGHGETIDLAILDMVMPRLGGREVLAHIRQRCPRIRVLFTSGYTGRAHQTNLGVEAGFDLLQKPFSRETLLRAVHEVLNRSKS